MEGEMSMELPLTVTVLKNASSDPLNRTAFLYVYRVEPKRSFVDLFFFGKV